jgi:hypothetical protein
MLDTKPMWKYMSDATKTSTIILSSLEHLDTFIPIEPKRELPRKMYKEEKNVCKEDIPDMRGGKRARGEIHTSPKYKGKSMCGIEKIRAQRKCKCPTLFPRIKVTVATPQNNSSKFILVARRQFLHQIIF